ncbi:hypothetical protein BJX96DRAFT_23662 [Aspergillus floccosus]
MSSVLNHVPSRSRVCSLRAAHLFSSCSRPKGHLGDGPLRPLNHTISSNLPSNTASRPLILSRSASSVGGPASAQFGFYNDQPHGSVPDASIASSELHSDGCLDSQPNPLFLSSSATHKGQDKANTVRSIRRDSGPSELETSENIPLASTSNSTFDRKRGKRTRKRLATDVHNPRRLSKRLPGAFSPTPTEYLIDTLQNAMHMSKGVERHRTYAARNASDHLMIPLTREQRIKFKIHHRMTLQQIVADYIYRVDRLFDQMRRGGSSMQMESDLGVALRKVFLTREHRKYLKSRYYSVADVVAWAWILRSESPYQAILRLLIFDEQQTKKKRKRPTHLTIPSFIPLLLLRQSLDTKSFRLLLVYALHLMTGQHLPTIAQSINATSETVFDQAHSPRKIKSLLDPNTCATFAIRLLHHARQLWPEAQLPIARAYSFYLSTLESEESGGMTRRSTQVMARTSNQLLRLLSLPCKIGPFASAPIQQEAQFELLKAMARNRPVLPVTRQGYQAIIAVQLAHRKTFDERQSAELKAPSWPPWKEDKLGIDSQRGIEGMKSRAMRVMSQMKEAGYAHSRWEEVSSILAGWDTDRSPTIQTRTLSRHPGLLRGPTGDHSHHAIWEARIRATRTVREAWACFLAYQDQGLRPRGSIYAAMAEKLVYRSKAVKSNFDNGSRALPGDGPEVFPEPPSARDLIYVSTEPPTLNELLEKMLSEGIKPGGRFLALLLRSAPTLSAGLHYLTSSDLSNEQVKALCAAWAERSAYEPPHRKALDEIPDYLFSSFIYLLCKFSDLNEWVVRCGGRTADAFPIAMNGHSTGWVTDTSPSHSQSLGLSMDGHHPNTLAHAAQLLKVRSSQAPQPWVHMLFALKRVRITARPRNLAPSTQLVLAWHEVMEVTGWMKERGIDLGLQGFQALCKSFSRAVVAGVKDADAAEEGLALVSQAKQRGDLSHTELSGLRVEDMVNSGLNILKHQFDQLVFPDSKAASVVEQTLTSIQQKTDGQVTLPALCRVPSPAVLHAFVRSLGLAEDYDGLLSLLRWMSQYARPLKEASDERMNGDRIMRRTVVGIRTFLEGCWGKHSLHSTPGVTEASDGMTFTDPNLQEAYDIITATGVWGPWPSDEEVQEYLAVHWG